MEVRQYNGGEPFNTWFPGQQEIIFPTRVGVEQGYQILAPSLGLIPMKCPVPCRSAVWNQTLSREPFLDLTSPRLQRRSGLTARQSELA